MIDREERKPNVTCSRDFLSMLGFFLKMENSRIWIRNEEMEEVEQRNSFFFFSRIWIIDRMLKGMENFYFYSSKETKSKEVTQGSETNERNVRKAGLLNSISFFSFGCRGVAGRGARRQRGLQGVPQPVANSLNDELRFFQMTILR